MGINTSFVYSFLFS